MTHIFIPVYCERCGGFIYEVCEYCGEIYDGGDQMASNPEAWCTCVFWEPSSEENRDDYHHSNHMDPQPTEES